MTSLERLNYLLTGEESPIRLTEREKIMRDKFLKLLNKAEEVPDLSAEYNAYKEAWRHLESIGSDEKGFWAHRMDVLRGLENRHIITLNNI